MNDCKSDSDQSQREQADALEEMEKHLNAILLATITDYMMMMTMEKKTLIKRVIENCQNETTLRWLRENSESLDFLRLVDMFNFLKEHIDEEEKKDHSNNINITFVAHGSIRDSMIPASCLLPLPSITDVILYSPWNCYLSVKAVYGVATGRMKPQHREFYCGDTACSVAGELHRPTNLPDHWNSMKKAGDQKIPNITLSPLEPSRDNVWKEFQSLSKQHGPPGRNHIVIPFILPGKSVFLDSVPFSVVTLALSLVLLSSRFKATVHLTACLSDRSAERKFDQDYLKQQYAYTINNTSMTCSPDMFSVTLFERFERFFFG
ncbi:uncharacterized protein LOC121884512 [Thunnus maccoyii]|uniref:uncharacterized protein LOC121884512 n=1 Tax=Thunnus maccoyii TaxID=8240 RepID=UPI001C4A9474|nr:uncharacterized protein LOC121884512 [Thunnus maccoyii]